MKKKALLLASMGALVCTVGVTALTVGGANHLDAFAVKADPTGYSITFDASDESTTVEAVGGDYAIYTTTPRGAKVGVVGHNHDEDDGKSSFTFNGASFWLLYLFDYSSVLNGAGAYQFSTITGFAISFEEGGLVAFDGGDTRGKLITSGEKYDVSVTPDGYPMFYAGNSVTVSSLTIWYSC